MPRNIVTLQQARAVKEKAVKEFRGPGVVGVGITKVGKNYGIKVNVRSVADADSFPKRIDGVPIKVEVTGSIYPR